MVLHSNILSRYFHIRPAWTSDFRKSNMSSTNIPSYPVSKPSHKPLGNEAGGFTFQTYGTWYVQRDRWYNRGCFRWQMAIFITASKKFSQSKKYPTLFFEANLNFLKPNQASFLSHKPIQKIEAKLKINTGKLSQAKDLRKTCLEMEGLGYYYCGSSQ